MIEKYLQTPVVKLTTTGNISLPEIGRIVPAAAPYRLHPVVDIKANGPAERLALRSRREIRSGERARPAHGGCGGTGDGRGGGSRGRAAQPRRSSSTIPSSAATSPDVPASIWKWPRRPGVGAGGRAIERDLYVCGTARRRGRLLGDERRRQGPDRRTAHRARRPRQGLWRDRHRAGLHCHAVGAPAAVVRPSRPRRQRQPAESAGIDRGSGSLDEPRSSRSYHVRGAGRDDLGDRGAESVHGRGRDDRRPARSPTSACSPAAISYSARGSVADLDLRAHRQGARGSGARQSRSTPAASTERSTSRARCRDGPPARRRKPTRRSRR